MAFATARSLALRGAVGGEAVHSGRVAGAGLGRGECRDRLGAGRRRGAAYFSAPAPVMERTSSSAKRSSLDRSFEVIVPR